MAATSLALMTPEGGLSRYLSGVVSERDMHIGMLDAALIGYQLARTLR